MNAEEGGVTAGGLKLNCGAKPDFVSSQKQPSEVQYWQLKHEGACVPGSLLSNFAYGNPRLVSCTFQKKSRLEAKNVIVLVQVLLKFTGLVL